MKTKIIILVTAGVLLAATAYVHYTGRCPLQGACKESGCKK